MDIFKDLPGISGWPGTVLTLLGILVYGFYITRSAKGKAEKIASAAKDDAIDAMNTYLDVLKERIKDAENENVKMQHTIETIISALKTKGIYITIDGDMIHIHEDRNGTTTTRIHHKKKEEETT
jgi:hypothetical protein